jgi:hypothetical protein
MSTQFDFSGLTGWSPFLKPKEGMTCGQCDEDIERLDEAPVLIPALRWQCEEVGEAIIVHHPPTQDFQDLLHLRSIALRDAL